MTLESRLKWKINKKITTTTTKKATHPIKYKSIWQHQPDIERWQPLNNQILANITAVPGIVFVEFGH